ncbi:Protein kinase C-like 1, partial [Chytriomyces hyalinus]
MSGRKESRINDSEVHDEIHEALHRIAHVDFSKPIIRNAATAVLYEEALAHEAGTALTSSGALALNSGSKKGRSPNDKRIVDEPSSTGNIWWGPVNIKMSENSFMVNRERAVDYLNTRPRLYVFDGFAGWDPKYRIK